MDPAFIKIIPSLLWFLHAFFAFCLFYQPIRRELLPKINTISALGVELSFAEKTISAAFRMAEKGSALEGRYHLGGRGASDTPRDKAS